MRHLLRQQSALIAEQMTGRGDVLELGCGVGDFLAYLSQQDADHVLIGLDVSPACLRLAREQLPQIDPQRVHLLEGDAARLSECLDAITDPLRIEDVVMRGLIHHLETPERAFREVFNILREHGRLTILEGNVSSRYRRLLLGFADLLGVQHEISEIPHTPPDEIYRMLKDIGFENIQVRLVPGLLAPISYVGVGGKRFWRWADRIGEFASWHCPKFFGWWYLLTADKAH